MLCASQVTNERPKSTPRVQCNNGLIRDTDNRFSEGKLIHRPVYVFPENRDTKFPVFPLEHCPDWKLARYSSSIQEITRASYLTSGAAATKGVELLSPQPTIVCWLDQPNEKNMHGQEIPYKPLPNGGNTGHRKKVKNSLTTCPTCQVAASTSSGLVTAPLISESDTLHDDHKPPKRSSKKRRSRRATRENLILLPQLLHEEQSDGKDGPGCTGSSNITAGEKLSCKGAPYLDDGPNTANYSKFDGSAVSEHVYSCVGEESNSCQRSSCACVCNSNGATADSFFEAPNSDKCGDCSIDIQGRLTMNDKNEQEDSLQHGASAVLDSVQKACHLTGLLLSDTHAEDVTDTERIQCSSEACSSKMFLPGSSGRSGRRSRKTSGYNSLTATNRVVGANTHRHGGKENPVSVWQKVEKLNKSSGAGHVDVEDKSAVEDTDKGVQHDPNIPIGKHRCKKSCKQRSPDVAVQMGLTTENGALNCCRKISRCAYKKQTPFLYEQTGCQSPRNYYAPKNGMPKMPRNQSQPTEGLSMSQPECARDASDRSTATGIEKATLAPYILDSHSVPQATSEEAIQDDAHSPCLENKAVSTDLDSRNLCVAEMEEPKAVKSYSDAAHMSHKWVPVGKTSEDSVVEASVPDNYVSVSANIDAQRNVSDLPASTKRKDSEVGAELAAELHSSGQLYSKWQGHIETGTVFSKIAEAVSGAYKAQQRAEDVQLLIGRPLADFENFIYAASPVVHCTPCPTGCNSSSLCFHQTADISLNSIWQWYEEPGCYGLEVKAQDLRRSKGFWSSRYQFNAYFVPYLSAVQLFDKDAADAGGRSKTSPRMSSPPIFAKLLPRESDRRNSHIKDDQQLETVEPIFEFFESEQPFWRRQLFDKVKELIGGAKQSNCQMSGDPKNLELHLRDLHPASWYCVAWYPIYRIPDGKFQAAFLTYHSLGHWVHRRSSSDLHAGHDHAVLPVMGLQSYNDTNEWWFQRSRSSPEDSEPADSSPDPESQALQERVATLKQAAAAMARAEVRSKEQTRSRNRHPDYEFFLSWSR